MIKEVKSVANRKEVFPRHWDSGIENNNQHRNNSWFSPRSRSLIILTIHKHFQDSKDSRTA